MGYLTDDSMNPSLCELVFEQEVVAVRFNFLEVLRIMKPAKWIAELTEFARGRGRNIWPAPQGIGIDFADGYDACWFLVNEVTSTIPLDCEPENVTTLIQEFLRLEERREQALIIIRHC